MTATVEEDEAKTIATINVVRMNNGADDPDANKDGYDGDGDGNDDSIAMLANGMEVARCAVDATSYRGDVRWMRKKDNLFYICSSSASRTHTL